VYSYILTLTEKIVIITTSMSYKKHSCHPAFAIKRASVLEACSALVTCLQRL